MILEIFRITHQTCLYNTAMQNRTPKKQAVLLKLAPEILDKVDDCCDKHTELFEAGGRAGFITKLIYDHFGLPVPLSARPRFLPGPSLPVEHVIEECLDDVSKLVVSLAKSGRSLHQIVLYLNSEEIPPPGQAAKWYPMQVQRILTNAVALSLEHLKKGALVAKGL